MTDLPRAHLDDEALSAVLDDAGDDADARHLAGCDECSARLAALRAVSVAVGAPVPPVDPARLDAAVAAALSAQNVVPISVARGARRPPAWLGAAAAVAAVLGVAGLLAGGTGGSSSDDAETATGAVADDADSSESAIAMEESAGDDELATTSEDALAAAPSAGSTGVASTLGELRGADLRALVEDRQVQREAEAGDGGGTDAVGPCEAELRAGDPSLGAVAFRGDGTWDGEPVALVVFEAGGERRAFVVTDDGCTVRSTDSWSV